MKNISLIIIGMIIGFVLVRNDFTSQKIVKKEEKIEQKQVVDKSQIVTKLVRKPDGTEIVYKEEKKDIDTRESKIENKSMESKIEKNKGITIGIVSKNITDTKSYKDYGIIVSKEIIAGVGITGCYYLDRTLCLGLSINF